MYYIFIKTAFIKCNVLNILFSYIHKSIRYIFSMFIYIEYYKYIVKKIEIIYI